MKKILNLQPRAAATKSGPGAVFFCFQPLKSCYFVENARLMGLYFVNVTKVQKIY